MADNAIQLGNYDHVKGEVPWAPPGELFAIMTAKETHKAASFLPADAAEHTSTVTFAAYTLDLDDIDDVMEKS